MVIGLIDDVLKEKQLKDLVKAKPARSKSEKKLKKEDVEELIPLLVDIEANNGFVAIAHKKGWTASQVKKVWKAMQKRIAELQPDQPAIE